MADKKISELPIISGSQLASGDLFTLVDVSDTSGGVSGTNKAVQYNQISGLFASQSDMNLKAPITNPTFSGTVTIPTGQITKANLVNSTAYSVIGRSGSGSGVPADIVAGTNGVLCRNGAGTLGFSVPSLSGGNFQGVLPLLRGGLGVALASSTGVEMLKAVGVLVIDAAAISQEITLSGWDSAPSLGYHYFDIYIAGFAGYRIWFQTGSDSPPADGGLTLVEINYITNLKSDVVSGLTSALSSFIISEPSSDTILIVNIAAGACTAPDFSNLANIAGSLSIAGVDEQLELNPEIISRLP